MPAGLSPSLLSSAFESFSALFGRSPQRKAYLTGHCPCLDKAMEIPHCAKFTFKRALCCVERVSGGWSSLPLDLQAGSSLSIIVQGLPPPAKAACACLWRHRRRFRVGGDVESDSPHQPWQWALCAAEARSYSQPPAFVSATPRRRRRCLSTQEEEEGGRPSCFQKGFPHSEAYI